MSTRWVLPPTGSLTDTSFGCGYLTVLWRLSHSSRLATLEVIGRTDMMERNQSDRLGGKGLPKCRIHQRGDTGMHAGHAYGVRRLRCAPPDCSALDPIAASAMREVVVKILTTPSRHPARTRTGRTTHRSRPSVPLPRLEWRTTAPWRGRAPTPQERSSHPGTATAAIG